MEAKLTVWNNGAFKSYAYWDDGDGYKTVLYLNVELARPTVENFSEENEDEAGGRTFLFKRQRIVYSFDVLYRNPLLDVLSTLGLHDNVELTFIETGETYSLTNVVFSDNGQRTDKLQSATLSFDLSPVSTGCEQSEFAIISCV